MSMHPMKFGSYGQSSVGEKSLKTQVKATSDAEQQITGDGYMTAIFNMVFLL